MKQDVANRVLVNSFPKGGTNLVAKLLDLAGFVQEDTCIASSLVVGRWMPFKVLIRGGWNPLDSVVVGVDFPVTIKGSWIAGLLSRIPIGGYVSAHSRYSDHLHDLIRQSGLKIIQIIRDPRDIAVSHAYYIPKTSSHPLHQYYTRKLTSFDERLTFSIRGGASDAGVFLESIGQRASSLDGWLGCDNVLTIRFEELVGEKGGGSDLAQRNAIKSILSYLDIQPNEDSIAEYQARLFGDPGRTFRRGEIGGWHKEFSEHHMDLYREVAGDITEKWGYSPTDKP